MHKSAALGAAVVGGGLVFMGLTAPVSAAPSVGCGDTVTTDVVLTRHLECSGDGLQVVADGVTVDLNGFRIRGDGDGDGISVRARQVTVTGGRIEGFRDGVGAHGSTLVRDVTLAANTYGVMGLARVEVTDSVFVRNGSGLSATRNASVARSTFRENGTGIGCYDTNLEVVASSFVDNQHGLSGPACGLAVDASSFTGGDTGLDVVPLGFGMIVRDSTFKAAAGIGMRVRMAMSGTRVIEDNDFKDNGASGLVIDNDPAWPGVQVAGNLFKDNGFSPGGNVDPAGSPLTSGVWSDGGSTFTANRAVGNAGHGIEAYDVTDGGGNAAQGNGAEPQCLGVVCS
jgi:hypothetical protein